MLMTVQYARVYHQQNKSITSLFFKWQLNTQCVHLHIILANLYFGRVFQLDIQFCVRICFKQQ